MDDADLEAAAASVLVMVENNIPMDVQEMLVKGSKAHGVPPGVLSKVMRAMLESYHRSERIELKARHRSL